MGETGKPMNEGQPPSGYQEGGESIALSLVEGIRPQAWGVEMALLLGYQRRDLRAWLAHYRETHAEEIETRERLRRRKERLQKKRRQKVLKERGLMPDA
jgi:membrane protein required for beta-lactamase induction